MSNAGGVVFEPRLGDALLERGTAPNGPEKIFHRLFAKAFAAEEPGDLGHRVVALAPQDAVAGAFLARRRRFPRLFQNAENLWWGRNGVAAVQEHIRFVVDGGAHHDGVAVAFEVPDNRAVGKPPFGRGRREIRGNAVDSMDFAGPGLLGPGRRQGGQGSQRLFGIAVPIDEQKLPVEFHAVTEFGNRHDERLGPVPSVVVAPRFVRRLLGVVQELEDARVVR